MLQLWQLSGVTDVALHSAARLLRLNGALGLTVTMWLWLYLEHGLFCACLCVNSSLFSLFQLTGRPLACLFEPLQGALPCEYVCVQCPFVFVSS